MQNTNFKMFFNNKPATDEQLERVKEITVEQEVDMAWQAQIVIPIFADDKGKWTGEEEDFMKPYSQIRIEVKIGSNHYVPLIDGPIVGHHNKMSSGPGQSFTTLIVQDDSAYLNRLDRNLKYENKTCEEIAHQIYEKAPEHIKSFDITKDPSSPKLSVVTQNGTDMQILRSLAQQNGYHAFVLPGDNHGQSIGCFKPFHIQTDGLSPLILMGEERNINEFNVGNQASRPSTFKASYLNTFDKSIKTVKKGFQSVDLLGAEPVLAGKSADTAQIVRADRVYSENLDRVVSARAADSSYSYESTGMVDSQCYPDVLQPYRVITVLGANGRQSGDYLISAVTHKITISSYSQSFTLKRNSRSSGYIGGGSNSSNACAGSGGGLGVLGNFSASASLEVSIF